MAWVNPEKLYSDPDWLDKQLSEAAKAHWAAEEAVEVAEEALRQAKAALSVAKAHHWAAWNNREALRLRNRAVSER